MAAANIAALRLTRDEKIDIPTPRMNEAIGQSVALAWMIREKKMKPGLTTKVIGCLVAGGTDATEVLALETAAHKLGAHVKIVAPTVEGAVAADGRTIEADFQLAGGPSVLFDAVYVALSESGAKLLSTEAAAVGWVHDAFAHLKGDRAPQPHLSLC